MTPLRAVDKKGAAWNWMEEVQIVYLTMKDVMDSGKVLAHYDPRRSTRVYVAYSPSRVSATLSLACQFESNWQQK